MLDHPIATSARSWNPTRLSVNRDPQERGTPMTTKAMIEAMAAKGYWTSPGGATPAQTLYSAILRE